MCESGPVCVSECVRLHIAVWVCPYFLFVRACVCSRIVHHDVSCWTVHDFMLQCSMLRVSLWMDFVFAGVPCVHVCLVASSPIVSAEYSTNEKMQQHAPI